VDGDLLALIWFGLLGVLLIGYAILDGFDLGVGMLHLFIARDDTERRLTLNSIGPLWDGNEVWLVTFGGAMFAAFPPLYASVFSGFYSAFMALLFALIFRAVSIEFRSKMTSRGWRMVWDVGFSAGSFLAALLFGVAAGNVLAGVPLELRGSLIQQLNPYALLVGALTVTLFAMHGTIYLYLKTEGALQQRIHGWMWRSFGVFMVFYMFATMYTLVNVPHAIANFERFPLLWVVPVLNVLAIANIPRAIYQGRPGYAFVSSACTIAAMVFLLGAALFPNVLTSSPNPEYSLTIYNASSSETTLTIMLMVGMPAVLAYTAAVYWTFRGKVQLDEHSY
jgi:cytochrome d ubiquinol oxidase subunit II